MTRFLLIRHGTTDAVGQRLSGRAPGMHLNAWGRAEVHALADRLVPLEPVALYSGPLERARETAALIAERIPLVPQVCEALNEMDFGGWTGRSFADLVATEHFCRFNVFRSGTRAPEGESMLEVQARMTAAVERLRARHGDAVVALVSHADVIKAALALWLGVSLDGLQRIEISPASLSIVDLEDWGARVTCLNDRAGAHRA